jgi:hypothetical protein
LERDQLTKLLGHDKAIQTKFAGGERPGKSRTEVLQTPGRRVDRTDKVKKLANSFEFPVRNNHLSTVVFNLQRPSLDFFRQKARPSDRITLVP